MPWSVRSQLPRRRLGRALLLAVVVATVATPSSSAGDGAAALSALVVRGHGFGHGIGLSQWGAERRAAGGVPYRRILSFYYPGTALGSAADRPVRVLLADARPAARVGSRAPFVAIDAAGRTLRLGAGAHTVSGDGTLDGRAVQLPLVARPGRAPVRLGGTSYAGTLTVSGAAGALRVVNTLPLEQYLVGVVSSECPGSWPAAALQAQAVASRSYALASLRPAADFDLYPDDRSQNYHGLLRRLAPAAAAVRATRGQVLRYAGHVVPALFTAANGGLTTTPAGVWGGSGVPYYAVRADPFDARSPDTDWGPVDLSVDAVRAAFPAVPAATVAVELIRNAGRRVTAIRFVDASGAAVTVDGYAFQQRFGLRSTYFTLTGR